MRPRKTKRNKFDREPNCPNDFLDIYTLHIHRTRCGKVKIVINFDDVY